MKRTVLAAIVAAAMGIPVVMAQKPEVKGPRPKSKGEQDALVAMFNAQSKPDDEIAAAEALLSKYADTDFKDTALLFEAMAYQQKGDVDKAQVYAERAIDANPKNFQATLMLSEMIAQHTRENDLDRDDKLAKADKYGNQTIASLNAAEKPNPQLTDQQWEDAKKDLIARAHDALGMSALVRKNYDGAVNEFKAAVEGAAHPEPAYEVRLASAYTAAKKYDDAINTANKVMNEADTPTQIKQVAQSIRAQATVAKQKAAGGGASTAPPEVQIKGQPAAGTPSAPPQGETKKP
jgi:tetratricopeptide (TPR) repeat protein